MLDGPFYGLDPDIPNVSGRPHLYQTYSNSRFTASTMKSSSYRGHKISKNSILFMLGTPLRAMTEDAKRAISSRDETTNLIADKFGVSPRPSGPRAARVTRPECLR